MKMEEGWSQFQFLQPWYIFNIRLDPTFCFWHCADFFCKDLSWQKMLIIIIINGIKTRNEISDLDSDNGIKVKIELLYLRDTIILLKFNANTLKDI